MVVEYCRLCDVLGIDPDDKDNAVRDRLKDAMVLQFNSTYGTDVNSVASWQSLCRVLGISPVPPTLEECQSVGYIFAHILSIVNVKFSSARH